jgi:biopolymer transport protein TolQ
MNQDLSIVSLLIHASWVVQAVVALLIGISIASWAAIFRKVVALKKAQLLNDEFDREFWSGTSLNDLFAGARRRAACRCR